MAAENRAAIGRDGQVFLRRDGTGRRGKKQSKMGARGPESRRGRGGSENLECMKERIGQKKLGRASSVVYRYVHISPYFLLF